MPYARRVIFSTYVVPTQSVEMEETAIRQTEFQTSPNGTLGGKGSAAINATQWGDEWTSMEHTNLSLWEDFTTVNWEDFTSNWETAPRGEVTITDSSIATLSSDGNELAFLYVKNTGDTYNALVALDSGTNYYIIIPPGGSVHLRGDGTQLLCSEVRVKASNSAGTTIEFIIAKE
tara:strand:+ start:157 stop:681 length:525 start_codon:yes stop_codon:yes gene_type:complete